MPILRQVPLIDLEVAFVAEALAIRAADSKKKERV